MKSGSSAALVITWLKLSKKKLVKNSVQAAVSPDRWTGVCEPVSLKVSFQKPPLMLGVLLCFVHPSALGTGYNPGPSWEILNSKHVWAGCLATTKTVWIFHHEISINYFREINTQLQEVLWLSKYIQREYMYLDPSVTSQWQVLTYHIPGSSPSFSLWYGI